MSPFELRKERFSEFCLLARRLKKVVKNEQPKQKDKDGKIKRMIPVLN